MPCTDQIQRKRDEHCAICCSNCNHRVRDDSGCNINLRSSNTHLPTTQRLSRVQWHNVHLRICSKRIHLGRRRPSLHQELRPPKSIVNKHRQGNRPSIRIQFQRLCRNLRGLQQPQQCGQLHGGGLRTLSPQASELLGGRRGRPPSFHAEYNRRHECRNITVMMNRQRKKEKRRKDFSRYQFLCIPHHVATIMLALFEPLFFVSIWSHSSRLEAETSRLVADEQSTLSLCI